MKLKYINFNFMCKFNAFLLNLGYKVRLLYRSEDTIQQFKDRVELVKGDVTNLTDVENTVKDMDGVIVTLGTRNKLDPTTVMSTGLKNIVEAMEKYKIRPISVCLSSFLFWDPEKVPKQFEHLNAEHKRMNQLYLRRLNCIFFIF